ncbi:voltage-gated chloride channel [Aureococcus anophagefferens]|nr:voltage-gated chloride channel [Aureococcus anophagefferens]
MRRRRRAASRRLADVLLVALAASQTARRAAGDAFDDGVALARRFASCRRSAAEYGRLERSTAARRAGEHVHRAAGRSLPRGRRRRRGAARRRLRAQPEGREPLVPLRRGPRGRRPRRRRRRAAAELPVALLRHGPETLATRGNRRFAEPQRLWDRCDNGSFGFTFVRDPLAAFLSGFVEVLCRPRQKRSDLAFLAPSLRMPRGNATAVLAAYVADARRGAPLGRLSLHTWPQAFSVDARCAPLRFVGKLEAFDAAFDALFPAHAPAPAAAHGAAERNARGCKADVARRSPSTATRRRARRARRSSARAADYAFESPVRGWQRRPSGGNHGGGGGGHNQSGDALDTTLELDSSDIYGHFEQFGAKALSTLGAAAGAVGGVVLLLGAGLPVGKEGPFIHTGDFREQLLSLSYFRVLNDTPEFRHQMLSAAAAVGVSAAFGAPIGGIMFSIEATATFYVTAHYWGAFFAATCGAFVSRELGYDDYAADGPLARARNGHIHERSKWEDQDGGVVGALVYFVLFTFAFSAACVGLPASNGLVTPSFAIGAGVGRLYGEVLRFAALARRRRFAAGRYAIRAFVGAVRAVDVDVALQLAPTLTGREPRAAALLDAQATCDVDFTWPRVSRSASLNYACFLFALYQCGRVAVDDRGARRLPRLGAEAAVADRRGRRRDGDEAHISRRRDAAAAPLPARATADGGEPKTPTGGTAMV